MKVIKNGKLVNGVDFNFEQWDEYNHYTIAIYPIAGCDSGGAFGPRRGRTFRFAMSFDTFDEANSCLEDLIGHPDNVWIYIDYADPTSRNHVECL